MSLEEKLGRVRVTRERSCFRKNGRDSLSRDLNKGREEAGRCSEEGHLGRAESKGRGSRVEACSKPPVITQLSHVCPPRSHH